MQQQLLSAIRVAQDPVSDPALKTAAIEFLTYARDKADDTWPAALVLFMASDLATGARVYDPQTRYFALEVLGAFLDIEGPEELSPAVFRPLQVTFTPYIESEYINGTAESGAPYLRNKFSHTLALLFTRSYPDLWPTFITDLIGAMRTIPGSGGSQGTALNLNLCTLMLRVLNEVSGEIADQTVRGARTFSIGRQNRETRLKHNVREKDASNVITALVTVVTEGLDRLDSQGGESAEREQVQELVTLAVQTFASYVHWLDINLTVTPVTIPMLYRLINHPFLPFRVAASDALYRLISKGLQDPRDKLQLIKVLSLHQSLNNLEQQTRRPDRTDEQDDELHFRESLGKLLGIVGMELLRIPEDKTVTDESVKGEAQALVATLLPIALRFLADPFDDVSESVFPFLTQLFVYYRRQRKNLKDGFPLDSREAFFTEFMSVIIQKYQWDKDTEWGIGEDDEEPDDDDMAAFGELRKGLKSFMDGIAGLDVDLYTKATTEVVRSTLGAFVNGQQLSWQRVELALQLLYLYRELNKADKKLGKDKSGFCVMPASLPKGAKKSIDFNSLPLNPLGEMMVMLMDSQICNFAHPAVTIQWAETVCRYCDFFKLRKAYIRNVLEVFVGPLGAQNPKNNVRHRIFYLLDKFVQETSSDIPSDLISPLLASLMQVMNIRPEIPDDDSDLGEAELLFNATANSSSFNALLYLFEAAGTMIFRAPAEQQISFLQEFTTPLLVEMQQALQTPRNGPRDVLPILTVHHIMMALGNLAKGFPDMPSGGAPLMQTVLCQVFGQVAEGVLVALQSSSQYRVIRDAARFAFLRILSATGPTVQPFLPALLTTILSQIENGEISDFLNFMGLVAHSLKEDVRETVADLATPLLTHVNTVLNQPEEGTDDVVVHNEIKRAYLQYVNALVGSPLFTIFASPNNMGAFETFMIFLMRLAEIPSEPQAQKLAFIILSKAVAAWGVNPALPSTNGTSTPNGTNGIVRAPPSTQPIPGFDRFIYDQLIPLAFRVPLNPDLRFKDAETTLVLAEVTALLNTIVQVRGDEALTFLTTYIPSLGMQPEFVQEFPGKVGGDKMQFRKWFADAMRQRRHEERIGGTVTPSAPNP
ncbi:Xpo1-domain-containing protein [Dacryopinax primogenitus]|uniref:Exportin-T n=1 Tax=Dacryopinax primogenitus (strain DJM 731) TaxID=1858805 RepID=M5G987_DACPD|nr:Xpo1-domain-containing protein [Dacryopinax primogenitus]EJU04760.1 Xpo1-domain-containing protein [Dacryopinax primogenitus]